MWDLLMVELHLSRGDLYRPKEFAGSIAPNI